MYEGDVSGKLNKLPQKCHMKNCPTQRWKLKNLINGFFIQFYILDNMWDDGI